MGGDPRKKKAARQQARFVLGIEGGGTRTIALLADPSGKIVERFELGPLNLKLATDSEISQTLRCLRSLTINREPSAIALCLAGCRTETDRQRLHQLARRTWPKAQSFFIGSDLDSGLAAAFGADGTGILVISGTGSVVVGRNAKGDMARAGGWGHLLGDHGSGYWIALSGLRNAIRNYDRKTKIDRPLHQALARLCLNSPDELVEWATSATKDEIAALADVFLHRNKGLLLQAASFLAMDCVAVARKLHLAAPTVALAGGVLQNNRNLRLWVTHRVRAGLPGARIVLVPKEPAIGALKLAGVNSTAPPLQDAIPPLPLTEQRNPRTMDLDKRSASELIDTMLAEEARVIPALRKNKPAIEQTIKTIVSAFKRGGRLFYVGAGTSGRLGSLDANECPPTFSTDPDMIQAILAGGATALHSAVEGAEDDEAAGAEAMRVRSVGRLDVVIGIAASGSTPFVLGALDEAKRRQAKTFLLCCCPPSIARHPLLLIPTGPEVLTGSTRLKAGTATKLVLNMVTTISMIRLGKVKSNLMVDVKPTNDKLRNRACRIVATLKGCSEAEARRTLVQNRWNVKKALR
ncbi:MAG TPA: N-acetylmuramic acid 6-phosphate etherase [Verrucomicrobiae bacterium]|nr:N-acetylmuramic acid 6-phosphate etherase [Verrucomicrobiae bacterium]